MTYDFCGYATKNDLQCADGRIIRKDAFVENDGKIVPLVWQHVHDDPMNVLGHALLENRDDGVYAYCTFNNTEQGRNAKELVRHGDVNAMSIFANRLKQDGPNVIHGLIREVSLVLSGANPGALIDNIAFAHSDGSYEESVEEAVIYMGQNIIMHADDQEEEVSQQEIEDSAEESEETIQDVFDTLTDKQKEVVYFLIGKAIEEQQAEDEVEHADMEEENSEETVQDVFDTLSDKQKNVVYFLISQALEQAGVEVNDDEEGDISMKHNVFEAEQDDFQELSHSDMEAIIGDAMRSGSLKQAFLEHGVEHLDYLFPEAKAVTPTPEMITREIGWVQKLWGGLRKTPFSRIKSTAANLTENDARAKGYIKGNRKTEEQFALLKRVTEPQTIYKKQSLDRDDVIDITDIDVVAWLKAEMRLMLDEEIARAILIGDGRSSMSPDKIKEDKIRPVYTDDEMYTIHYTVDYTGLTDPTDKSNKLIDAALLARKDYKGSGNPTMYACTDVINTMLLAKDKVGRRLYATVSELADALRVKEIVEVPVLENATRIDSSNNEHHLLFLIFNPGDYTIGADKGGAVSLFDDFDIDYNTNKYLIETRCSGALYKPYSAIAVEQDEVFTLSLAVSALAGSTDLWGTLVSEIQSDVTIDGNHINGKLFYLGDPTKALVRDWGAGYFLALQFDYEEGVTARAGLKSLYQLDEDKAGVWKIENPINQVFRIVLSKNSVSEAHTFDLSGIELA